MTRISYLNTGPSAPSQKSSVPLLTMALRLHGLVHYFGCIALMLILISAWLLMAPLLIYLYYIGIGPVYLDTVT